MDDVIFQEFKGTGNMELVLDRRLADKRIFPAIDLLESGTRKEEKLFPPEMHERINLLRRSMLQVKKADEAMEQLIAKPRQGQASNAEFLGGGRQVRQADPSRTATARERVEGRP
jgi:transcription termination factor Rho